MGLADHDNSAEVRRLYEILSKLSGVPANEIEEDQPLFGEGLKLDSLSGINLMSSLEAEFDITLDDIDLQMDALDSVGNLVLLVRGGKGRSNRWLDSLETVARASRLKEGRAGVERIMSEIASNEGSTSRELAAVCALPTPTVSAVRKELAKAGLIEEIGRGARLTESGLGLIKGLSLTPKKSSGDYLPPRIKNSEFFAELVDKVTPYLSGRPDADTTLDQAKCLPETCAARALLALDYGCLLGKRIAFIGDDDFTSVGLSVLGQILEEKGAIGPRSLTVLDVDDRILGTLDAFGKRESLPINVHKHDMRNPISRDLTGSFDAFFTDPPYTVPGAELFLSRGIELCKASGFMAFFSFASKGPREMLEIHGKAVAMGLLVREVLPGFNRYEGASLWGNQSQMIVFEGTDLARTGFVGAFREPMYTADFRQSRKS